MSTPSPSPRTRCQNCDAPLQGPYCSACGQHDVDYSGSFWHLVEDALEGALHFDGKFFKSARFLFNRPGFLTNEFIAGRRARYTHPVRMYVFASFLFFAACVLAGRTRTPPDAGAAGSRVEGSGDASAGRLPEAKGAENGKPALKVVAGSVGQERAGRRSWLDGRLQVSIDPNDKVSTRELSEEFWHLMPEALILCVPFLALVLKLVYLRSRRAYLEHLIFALHVQTLVFLSLIVIGVGGALGSWFSPGVENGIGALLVAGMFCLIFRAFRVVYRQGRMKTAVRLALASVGYFAVLICAFLALGIASAYLVSRNSS